MVCIGTSMDWCTDLYRRGKGVLIVEKDLIQDEIFGPTVTPYADTVSPVCYFMFQSIPYGQVLPQTVQELSEAHKIWKEIP